MKERKHFGPHGNLGYGGVSDEVWEHGMKWRPDAIFQRGISCDPGRGYLGTGTRYTDCAGIKDNAHKTMMAPMDLTIPCLCSLGGEGGDARPEWSVEIEVGVHLAEVLR